MNENEQVERLTILLAAQHDTILRAYLDAEAAADALWLNQVMRDELAVLTRKMAEVGELSAATGGYEMTG